MTTDELRKTYLERVDKLKELGDRVDSMTKLVEDRLRTFIERNKTLPTMPDIIDSLANLYKTSKDLNDVILRALRDYATKLDAPETIESPFSKIISLLEQENTEEEN